MLDVQPAFNIFFEKEVVEDLYYVFKDIVVVVFQGMKIFSLLVRGLVTARAVVYVWQFSWQNLMSAVNMYSFITVWFQSFATHQWTRLIAIAS